MNLHRGHESRGDAGVSGGGTLPGARKAADDAGGTQPRTDTPEAATTGRTGGTDAGGRTRTEDVRGRTGPGSGSGGSREPVRVTKGDTPVAEPAAPAPPRATTTASTRDTGSAGNGELSVDIDRLGRRMDRAIGGFVDDPRRAVREADAVLDEAAGLIEQRRKELRQSWDGGSTADTEELRVALTRYRDLTRQLISLTAAQ